VGKCTGKMKLPRLMIILGLGVMTAIDG